MCLINTLENMETSNSSNINNSHRKDFHKRGSSFWRFFGKTVPRSQLVFLCQIFIIYVVIGSSIYNLSVGNKPSSLWIGLLASCLGYCLPNPSIDPTTSHIPYPPFPSNPIELQSPPTSRIYRSKEESEALV